ncbi:hypothetical protein F4814DRAFT_402338 [Daldinia grandis]|nr:hypothetical protein F4814DRAFT_402338 [Daldinia grandis]
MSRSVVLWCPILIRITILIVDGIKLGSLFLNKANRLVQCNPIILLNYLGTYLNKSTSNLLIRLQVTYTLHAYVVISMRQDTGFYSGIL